MYIIISENRLDFEDWYNMFRPIYIGLPKQREATILGLIGICTTFLSCCTFLLISHTMVCGELKVTATIKIKQDKSVVIHVFGFESRVVAFWSSRGKQGAFNRGMLK